MSRKKNAKRGKNFQQTQPRNRISDLGVAELPDNATERSEKSQDTMRKSKTSNLAENEGFRTKPKAELTDDSEDSGKAMGPPSVIVSTGSNLDLTNLSDGDQDDQSMFDNDYNSGMYRGLRGRRYCLSTLRFFGIMAFLWACQFTLMSSMKHLGVLEGEEMSFDFDFDPSIVAQRVIPQLQENWNAMFNESMSLAATYYTRQSQRPGYQLAQQGAAANYPVVMIPGFVTSGLEVWTSRECAKKYFRQRIWTGLDSARALFTDKNCWREHVSLDPYTGMDPEGIRLRASEGFEAADYFMANYWVWQKLLENLADIGYSPSTMSILPYDWRAAFYILEERDGYLTKLKFHIEANYKTSGKKVVLTSHSMGAQLVHYFFKWVTTPEHEGGGGGGKKWVDKHIHAYLNIAGCHLGVQKAASALLSGEMKDTVIMGTIGTLAEQWFGRLLRKDLWNTWGSLWGMLPKGGERIWDIGADVCYNITDPDDPFCGHRITATDEDTQNALVPLMLLKRENEEAIESADEQDSVETLNKTVPDRKPQGDSEINAAIDGIAKDENHTTADVLNFLTRWGAGLGSKLASAKLYSNYGNMKAKDKNHPKVEWLDPTLTPLPYAPNMKIYCLYGVGLDTERSYFYKTNHEAPDSTTEAQNGSVENKPMPLDSQLPFVLDLDVDDPERKIKHGMRFTDGDGSVPLLSLGYICEDGWKRKDSGLNPSGIEVVTVEYQNRNEFDVNDPFRGGPRSADHVDILGNIGMTEDFLRVVADFEPRNESHIVSNLREIAKEINSHPNGGIFKNNKKKKKNTKMFLFGKLWQR